MRSLIRALSITATLSLAVTACSSTHTNSAVAQSAGIASIASPDGDIVFSLSAAGGQPTYSVMFEGEEVVSTSRLGLRFKTAPGLDEGLSVSSVTTTSRNETWEQPWGERRLMREHYNELAVTLADEADPSRAMTVRVRVFDDGLGFRYEVPAEGPREIVDEITEFRVEDTADSWWAEAWGFNRLEYIYKTTPVSEMQTAQTPFTLRTQDGVHITIHEAALVDYSSMSLDRQRPGVLEAELRPWADGVKVKKTGSFTTPWRTIQISDTAVGLLNSDLILNLNEPNKLGDVSWVEPGKYIGIWWGMHINTFTWGSGPKHGATTENAKRYIDFAAEHGFAGVLIEGWNIGWDGDWFFNGDLFSFTQAYPDFDIEEVTRYAGEKGVRLIGHHETSGNVTNYERQLEDAFALYQRLGVTQVKSGYVADAGNIERLDDQGITRYEWHDGQFMARHHLKVVELAARYGISMNPHEPIKDTGLRRTYPNWVTREGARGMEFNAWGTPPNPPEHEPVLAWTRLMAGPMDFTPGIFDLFPNGPDDQNRPQTTLAKQLALYVTIYSPLQMAADLPENYEKRMDAFQFIKDVPVDWDQSVAIAGEVGDFVVWARKERGGSGWYLGAITDEEGREVAITLDFLDDATRYEAQIYRDGASAHWDTNPYDYVIETQIVDAGADMTLTLAPGGGTAIRFTPIVD